MNMARSEEGGERNEAVSASYPNTLYSAFPSFEHLSDTSRLVLSVVPVVRPSNRHVGERTVQFGRRERSNRAISSAAP